MTTFQEGAIYLAPDAKHYIAHLEKSRLGDQTAWTLVGIDLEQIDDYSWRDRLRQLLFVEQEKILSIQFAAEGPSVRDTAWRVTDLVRQ
jgi:hypothetical protein